MEFPTEFTVEQVNVRVKQVVKYDSPVYEMTNPIMLSTSTFNWEGYGTGSSGFTREEALDALVVGFKAAAAYLADITGRDDIFLTEDAVQVEFIGPANEVVSFSTIEEEV